MVVTHLTFMINFNIILMDGLCYKCEKKKYYFHDSSVSKNYSSIHVHISIRVCLICTFFSSSYSVSFLFGSFLDTINSVYSLYLHFC